MKAIFIYFIYQNIHIFRQYVYPSLTNLHYPSAFPVADDGLHHALMLITELFNIGKTEQQIEGMKQMNAFGRLGEPQDIRY